MVRTSYFESWKTASRTWGELAFSSVSAAIVTSRSCIISAKLRNLRHCEVSVSHAVAPACRFAALAEPLAVAALPQLQPREVQVELRRQAERAARRRPAEERRVPLAEVTPHHLAHAPAHERERAKPEDAARARRAPHHGVELVVGEDARRRVRV